MSISQMRQNGTGAMLWIDAAANEIQVMDAMAYEAGYRDHFHLLRSLGRGLRVKARSFGTSWGQTSTRRTQAAGSVSS
jgi:hypothetical protein